MIQATEYPGCYKVNLTKLDLESMGNFEMELNSHLSPREKVILLDFAEVEEISSAILGILLKKKMEMRKGGCEVYLWNVKPIVRRILKITKLAQFLLMQQQASLGIPAN
ncbi:STAS domain-containing protein [Leptospira idonii]|uniref:Anti-sigma factor antagonist n=1 Tax=Leptospira idonii TaxID=1193500 RepID=A0A4R9M7C3_9LEPT|nr:STAS domain-containing protein [Leptospira idonii]TGN20528.1 anti-sigma factor antagonist [Leptospira idonii]